MLSLYVDVKCVFVLVCTESVPDISSEGTALADYFLLVSLSNGTVVFTVTDLPGGDNLVIVLRSAVPVSGGVLHSSVVTAGLVTELDVEGVAAGHLQLGEVQLRLVLTTVELVVGLNLNQLSLLSPDKLTGVILHSFALQTHSFIQLPRRDFKK